LFPQAAHLDNPGYFEHIVTTYFQTVFMEKKAVIIVGAGPAGISTALSLQKLMPVLADDILILEKEKHPRPKLCGGGLTAYAFETLDYLDIQPSAPSFDIHKVEFFLRATPVTFRQQNVMRIVRRDEFDANLAEHARGTGLDLRENQRVVSLQRRNGKVEVRTESQQFQADVVVGADGANSLVRKRLVSDRDSRVSRLIEVVVPVDAHASPEFVQHKAVFDFRPIRHHLQGYVWVFPSYIRGQAHLNVGIFDSRISARRKANLKHLLSRKLAQYGFAPDVAQLQAHPERWFSPHGRYAGPNVLLVGDAAGIEPWLGEGISIALGYGPVAAQTICHAFEAKSFDFSNYTAFILRNKLGRLLNRNRRIAKLFYTRPSQMAISVLARAWESYFQTRHQPA